MMFVITCACLYVTTHKELNLDPKNDLEQRMAVCQVMNKLIDMLFVCGHICVISGSAGAAQ